MRQILCVAFLCVVVVMMLVPVAAAQDVPEMDDFEIDEVPIDEEEPFGRPVPDDNGPPKKSDPEDFQRELLEAGGDLPPPAEPGASSYSIIAPELPTSLVLAGLGILVVGGVRLARSWWRRLFAP